MGLPTCGEWIPDSQAFIKLLTHEANPFLGAWCLIGIVAASMSTADGAILAMGTVWSHNITRQLDKCKSSETNFWFLYVFTRLVWNCCLTIWFPFTDTGYPTLVTPDNLLMAARLSTIPFTLAATIIADVVRETGYLLIVAL